MTPVTTWEPRSYLRYAEVRFRAGLDLIARIPKQDYRIIYDLGCGTGYLTNVLAENFPNALVTGVDSSPEMLAEAKKQIPQPCAAKTQRKGRDDTVGRPAKSLRPEDRRPELQGQGAKSLRPEPHRPELHWEQADITAWRPAKTPDLIFSNAALQWVPHHKSLFPSLLKLLRPGGVLAVQMPRHFQSASHIELKKLVQRREWRGKLEHLLLKPIATPKIYSQWLSASASNLEIWETIYMHVLDGADPVVNFMRGTALRPFLTALSEKESRKFVAAFAERMRAAYPPQPTGQTLFPFRRLFLIAQR